MYTPSQHLVGFGASSMQGVGDSQGGFLRRVSALLQEKKDPVEVHNEGIGGHTTRDMLARIDRLETYRPYDLVVILGCNDMPRHPDSNSGIRTTRHEYLENLKKILPAIRGQRSLFLSSFAVSEKKTGVSPTLFVEYMAAATDLARSEGYEVRDLYAETKDRPELLGSDGMHFNDEGHRYIADQVARWFYGTP